MLLKFAAYSSKGTCCFGFRSFKALSLAPKKIVTATVLSAPALSVISLGKINLAHLVLYPESPRFTTSHFLTSLSARYAPQPFSRKENSVMESPKRTTRGQNRSRPRAPASASAMAAAGHPPERGEEDEEGTAPLPLR